MVKDYSKGKIYRIVSDQTDRVYIGSTIQTLQARFVRHKSKFKCGTYCSSAELLKYDDARIELIRDFPCNSKTELEKEEDNYMIACCKVVNCRRASRTVAEYYQDNKAELLEHQKAYYEANKAELLEKQKANYEANKAEINEQRKVKYDCPCGSSVRKDNKSTHLKSAKHQKYIILKE